MDSLDVIADDLRLMGIPCQVDTGRLVLDASQADHLRLTLKDLRKPPF